MRYFGGKQRISRALSAFLQKELADKDHFYDLFCGSCNVVSQIKHHSRFANDSNKYLIEMFCKLQRGWEPPGEVSYQDYHDTKNNLDADKALSAFIGFGCSFAGKWWGGYARGGVNRNYASNAKNSLLKKAGNLTDVKFTNLDYSEVLILPNSLVYCDIPYKGTTQYSAVGDFNHNKFYEWMKRQHDLGVVVYVSEYSTNIPDFAEVVWEQVSKKDIRNGSGCREVTKEVVFKHK